MPSPVSAPAVPADRGVSGLVRRQARVTAGLVVTVVFPTTVPVRSGG
ncbi:hypothetical protein ACRAKI_12665 [Saccharothrix isguenensis]